MSRRDVTINTVLGGFLVLTFFLILALPFLALRLVTYLLAPSLSRFLPSIALHQEITLAAIIAGVLLIEMIHALRGHFWRQAFLKFAYASGFAVVAMSDLRLGNSSDAFWILLPGFLLGNPPMKSSGRKDIDRPQFFLGMITLCALFAVDARLLGIGLLSHIVQRCTYVALFVWFAIRARKGWPQESEGPTTSSASASG